MAPLSSEAHDESIFDKPAVVSIGDIKKAQVALLEDLVNGWLTADTFRIPAIRDSQEKTVFQLDSNGVESSEALEYNWRFLVEYYGTFAPLGATPHQGIFKVVFYTCALRYGFFAPGTRKKQIKAWAGLTAGICRAMVVHGYTLASRAGGSRKKAISIIKKVINMALIESGQDAQTAQLALAASACDDAEEVTSSMSSEPEIAEVKKVLFQNPDEMETLPLHLGAEVEEMPPAAEPEQRLPGDHRQAVQESKPLLCGIASIDGSLEDQVQSMCSAEPGDDADLIKAQAKVKDAFRKRARGKQPDPDPEGEVPDGAPKPKGNPEGEAPDVAPKPKGKGRGRGRKAKNLPQADAAASTEQQVEPKKQDETPEANGGGKPENSTPNKRPSKSRKRGTEPANEEDATKAVKDVWIHKELELKAAGIPIPADYRGERKSYTLPADRELSRCAIGVLWMAGSFYIYAVPKETKLPEGCGLQLNGSSGCTVSFKKRGGIAAAWQLAKTIANWS